MRDPRSLSATWVSVMTWARAARVSSHAGPDPEGVAGGATLVVAEAGGGDTGPVCASCEHPASSPVITVAAVASAAVRNQPPMWRKPGSVLMLMTAPGLTTQLPSWTLAAMPSRGGLGTVPEMAMVAS